MGCICKKYRGIVLARLFIKAFVVLMRVAVLESVFHKYWLPWYILSVFFSSKCSLFHNSNLFGSCFIHILYTGCVKF